MEAIKRQPEFTTRHASILPSSCTKKKITIVGCGAIGSHTALSLARMGYEYLTLIDDDVVSAENMNSQGYYIDEIGQPKVDALATHIYRATGFTVEKINKRIQSYDILDSDILICAVDSMAARKDIFQAHKNEQGWFIDPRMGAEFAKLVVHKRDEGEIAYFKTWYSDDDAEEAPCTAKATVYCASMLSGLVVKAVKDISTGNSYTRRLEWNIRDNGLLAFNEKREKL